ncbi:25518_t:CDS:2 [Dentiscutata erythropus]|uniref:25518_t:CDS:1 n=1 Tax=Dentiscutata erythropus TaxID=1348616 RepID=A0A9N9A3U1_9GLOM|nr:25518_t:CDS:2 [Dentiscutata erythropus]
MKKIHYDPESLTSIEQYFKNNELNPKDDQSNSIILIILAHIVALTSITPSTTKAKLQEYLIRRIEDPISNNVISAYMYKYDGAEKNDDIKQYEFDNSMKKVKSIKEETVKVANTNRKTENEEGKTNISKLKVKNLSERLDKEYYQKSANKENKSSKSIVMIKKIKL